LHLNFFKLFGQGSEGIGSVRHELGFFEIGGAIPVN
jgi:hypothetical protein